MKGAITVIATVLIFGILIFIHEFGHFITARICGVGIKEFAIGMGPKLFSWKSKKYDTVYGVRALPIGGFVSMVGEDDESSEENAFCNKSIPKRMLIVVAGAAMNLILAFALMTAVVFFQGDLASTTIAEFNGNAISSSQLQVGDKIVSVDGVPVFTGNEALYEIMNQGYRPIDIKVKRDGKNILLKDIEFSTTEESGVSFGDLDFKFAAEKKSPLNYLKHSFFRSISTVKMTIDSILSLVTGRYGIEAISGPIGVAEVVGDMVEYGILNLIYLTAVLSANLGVFNLVPFPALDGGRFLLLIIEAIRKKPLKKEVEAYINTAGFLILFAFMIFIVGKDIVNLFKR